jgi:antitoxin ParD1/3/4
MPRSFALGERFEAFIDEQVRSGRYNSASEVVRAGLRLLEDQERLRALKVAELRRAVAEAEASGISEEDPDAFFDRLATRYAKAVVEPGGQ